jgi:hypothetical protein
MGSTANDFRCHILSFHAMMLSGTDVGAVVLQALFVLTTVRRLNTVEIW